MPLSRLTERDLPALGPNVRQVLSPPGEVVGYWLREPPAIDDADRIAQIARNASDHQTLRIVELGAFRRVRNRFSRAGGIYYMLGCHPAPGEPIRPLDELAGRAGDPNPQSPLVERLATVPPTTRFACPNCQIPVHCSDAALDGPFGAIAGCENCGEFTHVPTAVQRATPRQAVPLFGCALVSRPHFGEWFLRHPALDWEDIELLRRHGLWAYCSACKHPLDSGVLPDYALGARERAPHAAWNRDSVNDPEGPVLAHCAECGGKYLLALLISIPADVRAALQAAS